MFFFSFLSFLLSHVLSMVFGPLSSEAGYADLAADNAGRPWRSGHILRLSPIGELLHWDFSVSVRGCLSEWLSLFSPGHTEKLTLVVLCVPFPTVFLCWVCAFYENM